MKRPLGVILTTLVLGLFAAFCLLSTAGVTLALVFRNSPSLGNTPPHAGATPVPAILTAGLIFMIVITLSLVVWAILTIIGLLRLRNSARYSVLVLGGLFAAFGVLCTAGAIAMATILPMPAQPGADPRMMRGALAVTGIFYAIFAAVGTWWLVYFNLRSTKAYFLPGYAPTQPGHHNPYLDGNPTQALPTPAPGRFSAVPVSIIIVAVLFLLGAISSLICAALPLPLFLLGFIFQSPANHMVYLLVALLMGLLGTGLLRLDNRARLATYGVIGLGFLNMIILATPWGRGRLLLYNDQIYSALHTPPMPYPHSMLIGSVMVFSAGFGIVVYGLIAWLLHRHRGAFLRLQAV